MLKTWYRCKCISLRKQFVSFQNLMHKLRVTEKSSRQRISNESNNTVLMKKKLEEAERKIERLNSVIQVRNHVDLF